MKVVEETSQLAMMKPRQFSQPCIRSGLAAAMNPALTVISRTPAANCVVSTVGNKDIQSKVCCPNTMSFPMKNTTIVRYNRVQDNLRRMRSWEERLDDSPLVQPGESITDQQTYWWSQYLSCVVQECGWGGSRPPQEMILLILSSYQM